MVKLERGVWPSSLLLVIGSFPLLYSYGEKHTKDQKLSLRNLREALEVKEVEVDTPTRETMEAGSCYGMKELRRKMYLDG